MRLVRRSSGHHPARALPQTRALAAASLRAGSLALLTALIAAPGCGPSSSRAESTGPKPLDVVANWGEVGLSPGQFTYPRALDNDGANLWAIDKSARVQRLNPKTGQASAVWTMPDSALGKPCGVTIYPPVPTPGGPDQLVYVADTHYFRVMVYRPPADLDHPPELVTQWGSFGQGPGQFTYLTDVAILPAADSSIDRIYVSEYGGNDRINIFDKDHNFLTSFGALGSSAEPAKIEFNRPQSIQIDKDHHELIVTDACNHRVGVFTLDGKLIRWIGAPEQAGAGPTEFNLPYGLALLGDHTALVTEFGNHRVHHLDLETGQTLGLYGKPGRGPGELTNPWAITVLKDTVYVLDSGNARVQAFKAPRPVRRPALSAAAGSSEGHG